MTVFEEACKISLDKWVDSLPVVEEEHSFSEKHQKAMRKLFDKMRGDKYHKFTRKTTRFLIAAAIILSLAVTVLAVTPGREYLIRKLNDYSVYTVLDNSGRKDVSEFSVGYIPEGYTKTGEFRSDMLYDEKYNNGDSWFVASKFKLGTNINFDTEEYECREINVDGIQYVMFSSSSGTNGVIWTNEEFEFIVFGNLNENEILEIGKSLK